VQAVDFADLFRREHGGEAVTPGGHREILFYGDLPLFARTLFFSRTGPGHRRFRNWLKNQQLAQS